MPTILLKKSDTPAAVPTTANLTNAAGGAEVAVNTADRRMFTINSSSAVVELGNNPTSLNITTGNLNFSSTAQRITGDFSNATETSKLFFQTSTANGATRLGAIPNGTGTTANFNFFNNSNPTNASVLAVGVIGATETRINSTITGTGTYLPMTFYTNGSERMRLDTSGNVSLASGNLTFSGTGQRITGDMSNATIANRLAFQTSTTNGNTIVGAFPNGTGTNTRLQLFSASDPANASTASMEANATSSLVIINADKTGTGTYLPMTFYTSGSEGARLTTTRNLLVGTTTDVSGLSGVISDVAGNVRAIPRAGAAKTSTYTLAITDIGDYVELGTGGGIDVPNGVFSTGDAVSVFNNTTGNRTISLTITTAYIAGTDADKASVTLATRGIATILFISNSVCIVTGNVT